eukprot:TRINITY_DN3933_c0_g1_i5.p1 TRINITY_DN3933_c0_g1~~TRINITY_DN3933_c0_g1_i5.p1  ORF type:complete len:344 (+),score=68.75 TRINITY_DN3933_c0_g1_i5:1164-2195(+)
MATIVITIFFPVTLPPKTTALPEAGDEANCRLPRGASVRRPALNNPLRNIFFETSFCWVPVSARDKMSDVKELEFNTEMNISMYRRFLNTFPVQYQSLDPNRMTILYFTLSAMDILDKLDLVPDKPAIIDWVYAQQVLPSSTGEVTRCGFACGPNSGARFDPAENLDFVYHEGNIAMTYSALCILKILGDDYSKINKPAIIGALKHLQTETGSFRCLARSSEDDMRFVYCACAISELLGDWSGFDLDLTTNFILNSQALDGAFGMGPDQEGHGGSTYCAVASLALLQKLDLIRNKRALVKWCVNRQGSGFQGRPYKDPDTCYSYWIGATMKLLGSRCILFLKI